MGTNERNTAVTIYQAEVIIMAPLNPGWDSPAEVEEAITTRDDLAVHVVDCKALFGVEKLSSAWLRYVEEQVNAAETRLLNENEELRQELARLKEGGSRFRSNVTFDSKDEAQNLVQKVAISPVRNMHGMPHWWVQMTHDRDQLVVGPFQKKKEALEAIQEDAHIAYYEAQGYVSTPVYRRVPAHHYYAVPAARCSFSYCEMCNFDPDLADNIAYLEERPAVLSK